MPRDPVTTASARTVNINSPESHQALNRQHLRTIPPYTTSISRFDFILHPSVASHKLLGEGTTCISKLQRRRYDQHGSRATVHLPPSASQLSRNTYLLRIASNTLQPPKRTHGPNAPPDAGHLRLPLGREHVAVDRHHRRALVHPLRIARPKTHLRLPGRLPLCAANRALQDAHLPPQRRLLGPHLPGYTQG